MQSELEPPSSTRNPGSGEMMGSPFKSNSSKSYTRITTTFSRQTPSTIFLIFSTFLSHSTLI